MVEGGSGGNARVIVRRVNPSLGLNVRRGVRVATDQRAPENVPFPALSSALSPALSLRAPYAAVPISSTRIMIAIVMPRTTSRDASR